MWSPENSPGWEKNPKSSACVINNDKGSPNEGLEKGDGFLIGDTFIFIGLTGPGGEWHNLPLSLSLLICVFAFPTLPLNPFSVKGI